MDVAAEDVGVGVVEYYAFFSSLVGFEERFEYTACGSCDDVAIDDKLGRLIWIVISADCQGFGKVGSTFPVSN